MRGPMREFGSNFGRLSKQNRFACFVVANFRNVKTGFYNPLVSDTIRAFQKTKVYLYNEGILVTAIGSLPLRAGRIFKSGRNSIKKCILLIKNEYEQLLKKDTT